jgi:hypothetical protein
MVNVHPLIYPKGITSPLGGQFHHCGHITPLGAKLKPGLLTPLPQRLVHLNLYLLEG